MTLIELAKMLDGREYPLNLSRGLRQQARSAGLVIVCGASDDQMQFEGAIDDEIGCFHGGSVRVDSDGIIPNFDDIDKDDKDALRDYFKRENGGHLIEALWCAEPDYSWTYKTDIPHTTFEVIEDGEPYCRGIVFDLAALRSTTQEAGDA